MEIVLVPLNDGRVATIVTEDGTMYGPDHELTIIDLTVPTSPGPVPREVRV
jgi:hypothetical protein